MSDPPPSFCEVMRNKTQRAQAPVTVHTWDKVVKLLDRLHVSKVSNDLTRAEDTELDGRFSISFFFCFLTFEQ